MKKIFLSALFVLIPSFASAAGWCTTAQCFVSRSVALTPGCVMQCNDTLGANVPLGEEEIVLSCRTSGSNYAYCPGFVAPVIAPATVTTPAVLNDGNSYTVTTITGGVTTTTQVNVQQPRLESTDANTALADAALQFNTTATPIIPATRYIREVPFNLILSALAPGTNAASGGPSQTTTATDSTATATVQTNNASATGTVKLETQALPKNQSVVTCTEVFSLNLRTGIENDEVLKVQKFLNKEESTRVHADGPGSPGKETRYFGVRLLDAIKRFQSKYSTEILVASNIQVPTGYWGPATRAHANKIICKLTQ